MTIQHARFNTASNPIGNPYRWGYCDYVMGRESNCPWSAAQFWKQAQYVKGYLAAQSTGVRINDDLKGE